ncbi:MAG: hypothetical protein KJ620_08605 [Candidatus Edwardsbacteria bacterium]|nr:hypothetical protein [Candidatus Edwardsbacteria bacterium]MBU1576780.1 hypothetical protein [Candidatus Edwardsbacteria bacterium]MBU2464581.1 hypothetical protein [Candidatus Edwardsbacteria bacterium]MBU2593363.1 hypothetical protein [Candidatus Edwardsbacteria bacterium]
MLFSEQTLKQAWQRAGGKCESTRIIGGEKVPCCRDLHWEKHGQLHEAEGWLGHHRVKLVNGIIDVAANCDIICRECHHRIQPGGNVLMVNQTI